MKKILVIILIIWNLIVYAVYGFDKHRAKVGKSRVPEKTLMLMALFFGGAGALLGMQSFRHKTKHKLFTIGVPICLVINIAALFCLIYLRIL